MMGWVIKLKIDVMNFKIQFGSILAPDDVTKFGKMLNLEFGKDLMST